MKLLINFCRLIALENALSLSTTGGVAGVRKGLYPYVPLDNCANGGPESSQKKASPVGDAIEILIFES